MNFRDIGGHETIDGRRVHRGRFYRSGQMSGFTDHDIAAIRRLSIRSLCDFRAPDERERSPTRWIEGQPVRLSVREDHEGLGSIAKFYDTVRESHAVARSVMTDGYRKLPYLLAPSYRGLFEFVVAGEVPVLFHCTVGKDRTGIAAALLLSALGVPRELVVEDFRASDQHYDELFTLVRSQALESIHQKMDDRTQMQVQLWEGSLDRVSQKLDAGDAEREKRFRRILETVEANRTDHRVQLKSTVDQLHAIKQDFGQLTEALTGVMRGEGKLVELQTRLSDNLRLLRETQQIDEAVHGLTAAIHLLTARSHTKDKAA